MLQIGENIKEILPYFSSQHAKKPDHYEIVIPVYYTEKTPSFAWRRVFKGTKEECEKLFSGQPDYIVESIRI